MIEANKTLYDRLRERSAFRGEKNDCSVVAVAVVTGLDYDTAHAQLKAAGRKDRRGPSYDVIFKVLKDNGLETVKLTSEFLGHSIRTLGPLLPQDGIFMVGMRKHVAGIRDGNVEDWSQFRKKHVEAVWKLVPAGTMYEGAKISLERKRNIVVHYEKPTQAVWTIADILFSQYEPKPTHMELSSRKWWGKFRAMVSAECQANGINATTAAVQTGKWMKDNGYYLQHMSAQ